KIRVREESLEYKKEGHLDSDPAIDTAGIEGNHIQLKNIAFTEGLSKNSTQKLIEKNMPAINYCYTQVSGKQGKLKGEIVVTLVVDPEGRVIKVDANRGKMEIKNIERCIVQKLRELHFPAPERGGNVTVTITLTVR
ncbi:MAG: AgmX/PglI C-terminal domain-containing protein, partial [Proteobacteria bacterium]|nr:AgmX/PglI C-terminal domain-containing protein [Pseudomonadota bacterium]